MESALKHIFKRIHYSDLPQAVKNQFIVNHFQPRMARRGWKVYYTIDSTYIQNILSHWYVASDLPKDFISILTPT